MSTSKELLIGSRVVRFNEYSENQASYLLEAALSALNQITMKSINHAEFKNSYEVAKAIEDYLEELELTNQD